MTKGHAERLAKALESLGYIETVNLGWDLGGMVQVLCRVNKTKHTQWAKVVEAILLGAEQHKDTSRYWDSHICRLYILKDGKLVYGWHVLIRCPDSLEQSLDEVVRVIRGFAPAPTPAKIVPINKEQQTPKKGHLRVPEADAKGNPIVPESHRVWEQPMAGLDGQDRNTPGSSGKGAYGLYQSNRLGNPFKAPQGGGKVGG